MSRRPKHYDRPRKHPGPERVRSSDSGGSIVDQRAPTYEEDDGYPGPCSDPDGHEWPQVEEHERCLCIHCGADGDA